MSNLLFPSKSRSFAGKRWLKIFLRTMHLLGTAGIGGGFLYHAPQQLWITYLWLVILSGLAIIAVEIWSNGIWLVQVRGVPILLKLLILSVLLFKGEIGMPVIVAVIAISGVISHAPGDIRYFSILHGKRVDSL